MKYSSGFLTRPQNLPVAVTFVNIKSSVRVPINLYGLLRKPGINLRIFFTLAQISKKNPPKGRDLGPFYEI